MRLLSNLPASVRARLLNRSKADGQTFQSVLTHYAIERLLYRLAASSHAHHFVLKGAQLFRLWFDTPHRTTKDLDLAGYGLGSAADLAGVFRELCEAEVEPDGMVFDPQSVRVEPIREEQEHQGQRVALQARLEQARVQVQIDVGLGNAVVPPAEWVDFPALLEFPAPRLRAYPPEATIAESCTPWCCWKRATAGPRTSSTSRCWPRTARSKDSVCARPSPQPSRVRRPAHRAAPRSDRGVRRRPRSACAMAGVHEPPGRVRRRVG